VKLEPDTSSSAMDDAFQKKHREGQIEVCTLSKAFKKLKYKAEYSVRISFEFKISPATSSPSIGSVCSFYYHKATIFHEGEDRKLNVFLGWLYS
jgi:hypothetical protein